MIKKLLFACLAVFSINLINAQSFAASVIQQPTCYGYCNGSVTFTTSTATGPFNMVMTNSASCPNSTVTNSNQNSITISSVCACSSDYTVSIFSGTVLVGVDYVQFPVTSTSSLAVNISSITPATCSSCCTGSANIVWSGGNTSLISPTITIDGNTVTSYTPAGNLCPGLHTVCATDQSSCQACNVFSVGISPTTGINEENEINSSFLIYPNPATDQLTIEAHVGSLEEIRILDLAGRSVLVVTCDSRKSVLNLSSLEEGIYLAEIRTSSGQISRRKIIHKANG